MTDFLLYDFGICACGVKREAQANPGERRGLCEHPGVRVPQPLDSVSIVGNPKGPRRGRHGFGRFCRNKSASAPGTKPRLRVK